MGVFMVFLKGFNANVVPMGKRLFVAGPHPVVGNLQI